MLTFVNKVITFSHAKFQQVDEGFLGNRGVALDFMEISLNQSDGEINWNIAETVDYIKRYEHLIVFDGMLFDM